MKCDSMLRCGAARWSVAAVLAVLLPLGSVSTARGQDAGGWVGTRVVVKKSDIHLKIGPREIDRQRSTEIYRVERVDGPWLWLHAPGVSGWARRTDVVPLDQAIEYFTGVIQSNPRLASAYAMRARVRQEKKDYENAIRDFNEAIRLDPKVASRFTDRGAVWYDKKEYDHALEDLSEAISLDPSNVDAFNKAAWISATCPDAKYRDGQRAVNMATRACELTESSDPYSLGTLAAASAEAGDFASAVKFQEKAVGLLPRGDSDLKDFRARLELYKAGKPCRDQPGT